MEKYIFETMMVRATTAQVVRRRPTEVMIAFVSDFSFKELLLQTPARSAPEIQHFQLQNVCDNKNNKNKKKRNKKNNEKRKKKRRRERERESMKSKRKLTLIAFVVVQTANYFAVMTETLLIGCNEYGGEQEVMQRKK